MIEPAVLNRRPSPLLAIIGGWVATLLLAGLFFLAPVFGFPFLDFPRLVGGIFTESTAAAFWLGFWIFFLVGVFVFAPLLSGLWPVLPGPDVGLGGAVGKGFLWGLTLAIVSGFLVPLFGALNQLSDQGLSNPGLFALSLGPLGPVELAVGHVSYGLALALVAAMGQGISPLATVGWLGYTKAETPPRRIAFAEARPHEARPAGSR